MCVCVCVCVCVCLLGEGATGVKGGTWRPRWGGRLERLGALGSDHPESRSQVLGRERQRGEGRGCSQWEVSFELGPPGPEKGSAREADLWSETFHHLAARAIIRDFEQLAEREGDIEQGERRGPASSS